MVVPIPDNDLEFVKKGKSLFYCLDCDSNMEIAWGGSYGFNQYVKVCPKNPLEHNDFGRPAGAVDKKSMPGWKYTNKEKAIMGTELGPVNAKKVMKYQGVAALTLPEAMEIVQSYWPTAPPLEQKKAALMCQRYNLDPGRKQIHLIPFKRKDKNGNDVIGPNGKAIIDWSMAIGIGATRINGRRMSPNASYTKDSPRPATQEEQMLYRGLIDKKAIWHICWLKNKTTGEEVFGMGSWPLDNNGNPRPVKGSDKGNTAQHMADLRAERQAWDKLCPEWLPPGVMVYDEQYSDPPKITVSEDKPQAKIGPAQKSDQQQIKESESSQEIEGSAEEIPGDDDNDSQESTEDNAPIVEPTPIVVKKDVKKSEPSKTVKPRSEWEKYDRQKVYDFATMEKLVLELSGLKPDQIYSKMGVKSRQDLGVIAPYEVFMQIREIMAPMV